jgi:hypothetical protein
MSKNRRILGLTKTPAQAATERHEDALLQKVAMAEGGDPESTVTLDVTGTAVVPAGTSSPQTTPPPQNEGFEDVVLDESVPYATVRGIPGVEFIQGKDYFGRDKRAVREAPVEAWYFAEPPSKKKSAMDQAEEARAELRRNGLWQDVPRLPRALIEAERENARAAAAEAHAA